MESKNKKKKVKAKAKAKATATAKVNNNIYIQRAQRRGANLSAPANPKPNPFPYPFPVPQGIITPQGGVIQPTAIQALEQSINNLSNSIGLSSLPRYVPAQQNMTPLNARIQDQSINMVPPGVAQMEAQPMVSQTMNMAGSSSSFMGLQAPIGQLRAQATMTATPRPQTQSLPTTGGKSMRVDDILPLPSSQPMSIRPAVSSSISTADNPSYSNQSGVVKVKEPIQRSRVLDIELTYFDDAFKEIRAEDYKYKKDYIEAIREKMLEEGAEGESGIELTSARVRYLFSKKGKEFLEAWNKKIQELNKNWTLFKVIE